VAFVTSASRGTTRTSAFRADTRAQQNKHRSERVRGANSRQDHGMMHADTDDKHYKSRVSVCMCVCLYVYVSYISFCGMRQHLFVFV
jgi:hypothetical protein